MGNQLVIPSMSNWYEEPLKKMKIRVLSTIDSGTYFLTLDCLDQNNNSIIVKAYEYTEPLENVLIVQNSLQYFSHLKKSFNATQSIVNYSQISIVDRCAFLVRPKMQFTLSQRLQEYPLFEDIEKYWVIYQMINAVLSLHSINLVHGSLNPDNIFVDWDNTVKISDMAPFKPTHIRADRPNVFHHYFSSSSRNGSYFAPEQVLSPSNVLDTQTFNSPTFSTDYFSLGCIIYYIYTGTHLFTFSSLIDYIKNKDIISEKLKALPDHIREFTHSLLNIDFNQRVDAISDMHHVFPKCFQQIHSQFEEFRMSGTSLTYLVSMIPVFSIIVEDSATEIRVIFANIFSRYILVDEDVGSIVQFTNYLIDFVAPLSSEFMLCRTLPNVVGLLSSPVYIVRATALRCITRLIGNCKSISDELLPIISDYLIPAMTKTLVDANTQQKCVVAEIIPKFVAQLVRLAPTLATSGVTLSHFLINEQEPTVVSAFLCSMNSVSESGFPLLNVFFPVLLSAFNHGISLFKEKLIDTFRIFLINTSPEYKNEMESLMSDLAHAALGFILHEHDPDVIASYLTFIHWYVSADMWNETICPDIYESVSSYLESPSEIHRFLATQTIKKIESHLKEATVPHFVLSAVNQKQKTLLIQEPPTVEPEILNSPQKLITKVKTSIKSHFRASQRISRYPITAIAPLNNQKYAVSDGSGAVLIATEESSKPFFELGSRIYSMLSMDNSKVLIAHKNTVSLADVEAGELKAAYETEFRCMSKLNDNIFIGAKSDTLSIIDLRAPKRTRQLSFDNFETTALTAWPSGSIIAAGFREGFVDVIDLRVFKPLASVLVPSVRSMAPVAGGRCSVAVSSRDSFCVVDAAGPHYSVRAAVGGLLVPHCGRAVLAGSRGAFFLGEDASACSFELCENAPALRLSCTVEQGCASVAVGDCRRPPLHRHSAELCAFVEGATFVTGDEQGFVNFWEV